VFLPEIMTGADSQYPVLSEFTLVPYARHLKAYFEDSGWYTVDYSYAQHLAWGYHATCAFNGNCGQWPANYLCTTDADGCSIGGLTQAYCNYETGLDLPFQYQFVRQ
jgi:hypothetical protein